MKHRQPSWPTEWVQCISCSKETCWRQLSHHGREPGSPARLALRWLRRDPCCDEIHCHYNKSNRPYICELHRPGSMPSSPNKLLQQPRDKPSALQSPNLEQSVPSKDIAHVARIVQRPGDRCLVVVLNWRLYGGFRRISGPGARTAKASLMTKRVVEVCDGAL